MPRTYPRVLIFSQPFNTVSGGGITLTNLFTAWPKDKIAVLSYPFMLKNITTDICDTYYQIGNEELHWLFPFSIIKERYNSGPINPSAERLEPVRSKKRTIRSSLSSILVSPLMNWLDLVHVMSSIRISVRLEEWLLENKPDLLYYQISNRESINFALRLIDHLKIPAVIHMMDDWPSTICRNEIGKFFWARKIDSEFRSLLSRLDLHLSICDEMSSEYHRRYGYKFSPFHNSIDLKTWMPFVKKDVAPNPGTKVVLFSGRIGKGIEQSLFELASAVDLLRLEGMDIILQIQSPRGDPDILNRIKRYSSVTIPPPIAYDKIPELYSKADILIIANDFSRAGIKFLKYSMPTKAPEYMISGTPVLVYASPETALFKLFHENRCGHCVAIQNSNDLAKAVKLLLQDLSYRKTLSRNAVTYAIKNFDSRKIRHMFQTLLIQTASRQ